MSADNEFMSDNSEVISIASVAKIHKKMRGIAEKQCDSMTKMFILMCADHDQQRLFDILQAMPVWKQLDSSVFGITTTIRDYTNKKGITFKAHFSARGTFIKKAGAGDQPMSYVGNFRVCKELYDIDVEQFDEILGMYMDGEDKKVNISNLFTLKDMEDFPLDYLGNTGRIARNDV